MILKLKYFGMIAEVIGKDAESYELMGNTINKLDLALKNNYKELITMNYQFAVNQNMADNNTILNDNDEVALLPPFAGG